MQAIEQALTEVIRSGGQRQGWHDQTRVFQLGWRNGVVQANPVHTSAVRSGPESDIPAVLDEPLADSSV